MFGLGFGELVLIFLIALIFIGPKKLPELAKGLGQGLKEFQKAAKGLSDQIQDDVNSPTVRKEERPKLNDVASTPGGDAPITTPESSTEKSKEEKPS